MKRSPVIPDVDDAKFPYNADGSFAFFGADGSKINYGSDGLNVVSGADVSKIRNGLTGDRSLAVTGADGSHYRYDPDGSQVVEGADGSYVRHGADKSMIVFHPVYGSFRYGANGSMCADSKLGGTIWYDGTDGSYIVAAGPGGSEAPRDVYQSSAAPVVFSTPFVYSGLGYEIKSNVKLTKVAASKSPVAKKIKTDSSSRSNSGSTV